MLGPDPIRDDHDRALLEVVSSILAHDTLPGLFQDLTAKLSRFVHFDRLALLLYDESRNDVTLSEVHSSLPMKAAAPLGIRFALDETPAGEVIQSQHRLYLRDIQNESRYPRIMNLFRQEGIRTFCYLPLTTPTHRIGALGFGTCADIEYTSEDLALVEQALRPVAIAVENILSRQRIQRERDQLDLLLQVNNSLVSHLDMQTLFDEISDRLQGLVEHEFLSMGLWVPEENQLRLRVASTRDQERASPQDLPLPLDNTPSGLAFTTGQVQVFNHARVQALYPAIADILRQRNIRTVCTVPLKTARGKIGALTVGSLQEHAYPPERIEVLQAVAGQLAIAVENALNFARVEELNRRLKDAKLYLEEELQDTAASNEILGSSPGIRRVLQQIEIVAPTDATVLVYGETGSGKELVARAIHQKSPRAPGTFVKLNCAAIPTGLLESELFGHEKGAFTGAIAQKHGRFEIAHQGTLFLDEIGEIPLELQPKLLRVLQEKEFERLGGTRTIRSDARLVAATNRDLKRMTEANQFRSDLYYRLHVFPIFVPPLRDRKDDIPYLTMHFTQEFARRFGRKILSIPSDAIDTLVNYHWPGNVRELQNLIERSVILTNGDTLRIPVQELESPPAVAAAAAAASSAAPVPSGTLEDIARDVIVRTLRETNGVIGGPKGAAAKLGLKRTTLLYRMDKLGIQSPAPAESND